MADVKITQLPQASLPLTGTEVFPIVQGGVTVQAPVGSAGTTANIASLRNAPVVNGAAINAEGYYTANDGGGGIFIGVTGTTAGTYVDNGGTIIVPTGGNGSSAWLRQYSGAINVKWFGAKGDNTTDDSVALQAAIGAAAGTSLYFPYAFYKFTTPLVIGNIDTDFGGSHLHYTGAVGSFALTLFSDAGGGTTQTDGNQFQNFTLYQSDFTEYVTVTGSTPYAPPTCPANTAITNINPAGTISTTVTVTGATTGGYARATFSTVADGIEVTAVVTAPDTVTVYFNNYTSSAISMAAGTINVTVVNNAYHGLCLGGTLGILENVKVRGFTGVSLGIGSGICQISGVNFSGLAQAYYWTIHANVTPAAGWGLICKPRNNENLFNISTFSLNAYNDPIPRRAPTINQIVMSGQTNAFSAMSLESTSSEAALLLTDACTTFNVTKNVYIESNTSFVTPALPIIQAMPYSSQCVMNIRLAGGTLALQDKGFYNSIIRVPLFYVNSQTQHTQAVISRNFVFNGDFLNGSNGWSNFSTGTSAITIPGVGVVSGNRLRLDITVSGRPNLSQDIYLNGLLNTSSAGQNVVFGAWVKTNFTDVQLRIASYSSLVVPGDGNWYYITVPQKLPISANCVINVTTATSSGVGYIEISDVTVSLGNLPQGIIQKTNPVGSATYNPPNIAAGGQASTTVTVSGAVLGDYATASFGLDLQGIELSAYVSAADTVTCLFKNGTAGALDLASSTLRCLVFKA